ncbi:MAG: hypothetical protein KAI24_08510 [Planctomycetes bacterium]|nr:hypothetical protein [Planctomycetota bacterium]
MKPPERRTRLRHWQRGDPDQATLTMMMRPSFATLALAWTFLALSPSAQTPVALAPGAAISDPAFFVEVGDATLFLSYSSPTYELWRTDGSAIGTQLLANLPGAVVRGPFALGDQAVLFVQPAPGADYELWTSDGTAIGTVSLGSVPGLNHVPFEGFVLAGDRLYFESTSLWATDGTVAGTSIVAAISNFWSFRPLAVGHRVVFPWFNGSGSEPWISDGTPGGTSMIHDVNPGPASSGPGAFRRDPTHVYFYANNGAAQTGLWRTDGTSPGTQFVMPMTQQYGLIGVADGFAYTFDLFNSYATDLQTMATTAIGPGGSWGPQRLVRFGDRTIGVGSSAVFRLDGAQPSTMLASLSVTGLPVTVLPVG